MVDTLRGEGGVVQPGDGVPEGAGAFGNPGDDVGHWRFVLEAAHAVEVCRADSQVAGGGVPARDGLAVNGVTAEDAVVVEIDCAADVRGDLADGASAAGRDPEPVVFGDGGEIAGMECQGFSIPSKASSRRYTSWSTAARATGLFYGGLAVVVACGRGRYLS